MRTLRSRGPLGPGEGEGLYEVWGLSPPREAAAGGPEGGPFALPIGYRDRQISGKQLEFSKPNLPRYEGSAPKVLGIQSKDFSPAADKIRCRYTLECA